MGYINRVWMAATVAVVQGHTDLGFKMKTALTSLHHTNKRLFSSDNLRPLSGMIGSGVIESVTQPQADESLRRVMYLNCWGQGWGCSSRRGWWLMMMTRDRRRLFLSRRGEKRRNRTVEEERMGWFSFLFSIKLYRVRRLRFINMWNMSSFNRYILLVLYNFCLDLLCFESMNQ